MYRDYKIVCNTAAGRRRYMQYLFPQVLAADILDRYGVGGECVTTERLRLHGATLMRAGIPISREVLSRKGGDFASLVFVIRAI